MSTDAVAAYAQVTGPPAPVSRQRRGARRCRGCGVPAPSGDAGTAPPLRPGTTWPGLGWGALARPETMTVTTPDGARPGRLGRGGRGARCAGCRPPPLLGLQPRGLAPGRPSPGRSRAPGGPLRPAGPRAQQPGQRPARSSGLGRRPCRGARGDRRSRRGPGRPLHGRHDDHGAGHLPARGAARPSPGGRPRGDGGHQPDPAERPGRPAGRLVISSPALSRAMRLPNGHVFVRNVFGQRTGPRPHGPDPAALRRLRGQRAGRLPRLHDRHEPARRHRDHGGADDRGGGQPRPPHPPGQGR